METVRLLQASAVAGVRSSLDARWWEGRSTQWSAAATPRASPPQLYDHASVEEGRCRGDDTGAAIMNNVESGVGGTTCGRLVCRGSPPSFIRLLTTVVAGKPSAERFSWLPPRQLAPSWRVLALLLGFDYLFRWLATLSPPLRHSHHLYRLIREGRLLCSLFAYPTATIIQ